VGHDLAERLISERLDGERLAANASDELERHLETCGACRAFERDSYRLREVARFEVAPDVPDIAGAVVTELRRTRARPRAWWRAPRPRRALVPAVAVFVVSAIVGSLVVGGPWHDAAAPGAIAAADVARGIAGAAPSISAYEARYAITERDLAPGILRRDLEMHVWFDAPERFRLDVTDLTSYAHRTTPTDVRLIVDGSEWYVSAPDACPTPVCGEREILVRHRTPFSSSAPAPTDLVLPLTSLGDPDGLRVIGRSTVLGREAIEVAVPFERAAPLFPFLSLGGRWRPFFPEDQVRVWLDATDWFPLRWEVFPSADAERRAWELRFGLPHEPPGRPIFDVAATSVALHEPDAATFTVPASAAEVRDQGATSVPSSAVAVRTGFAPARPSVVGGLAPYRSIVSSDGTRSLLTYADGLSYLKLGETRTWSGDAPFGPVGVAAEAVALADGVGYYEPADGEHGRRLAIHAAGADLYLESNLPRATLLEIASSLPVHGTAMPRAWRVQRTDGSVTRVVTLARARELVPFSLASPGALPAGLGLATVEVARVGDRTGVTMTFRDRTDALAASSVRLHLERASSLPPASSSHQLAVEVGDVEGRWTPARASLEWVSGGVYRSLDGPGLSLQEALAIAVSIPESAP
jgi:hypothetical protein